MASISLSDLLDRILPDTPGCPSAVARAALLRTAIDFLTKSHAWSEVQDPVDVTADEAEYFLEAPTGARCIEILHVYTRAGELIPATLAQIASIWPDWQVAQGSAPSHYTRAHDYTSLRVYPMPTAPNGETLTVHAVYTLKDTADSIPDVIVNAWGDVLAHGAKARLMTMPGVTWKDLELARYHLTEYEGGRAEARIQAELDRTPAAPRVKPRRFGQ